MNIFDFEFLTRMEPDADDPRRFADLWEQGLDADEIALELARQRQAPLFINPLRPLEHGQPGDADSDWALIHDRSVVNIRQAFDRHDRTITQAAKIMTHKLGSTHTRGKLLGISQQALSKLIKNPETMSLSQTAMLAEFLGCTLDYMRGLVDNRSQFYGSASTEYIAKVYESLSPASRALATEMLKSIACRDRVIDRAIEKLDRFRHEDNTDHNSTANGT